MLRVVFSLFVCLFLNVSVPAAGADISVYQRGVLIQGQIQKGDYAKIIRFVRNADNYERFVRSVFLDSTGGDVVETIQIANLLEKSHAATHVASGARCYSACFILWMSGVSRNVSSGATLGVHRINVKVGEATMDPNSDHFARIARGVENYMAQLGTPRTILDKMHTTAPADLFVISQRWLAEQQLLAAVSYRAGFINAAQTDCGPEPFAAAMKDRTPLTDENEQRWMSQVKRWIHCADEVRARNQKVDEVTIAALIDAPSALR